ncbi:MAG: branched-chain amino acid transport system substrate-binding protein, partial [Alphaproteobacteria bacterium]
MSKTTQPNRQRRHFVQGALAGVAATTFIPTRFAIGGTAKIKIGVLLPYSGTYAFLGEKITAAMKLAIAQAGGKLGGRDVDFVQLDSEAKPPKATENTNKLITGEKVDFLVGPVHSGVAMAMAKIAREEKIITIVPNAGANQITGPLCAPNIFRTSFSNWQPSFPSGKVVYDDGHRNVVTMAWNYGAGKQALGGFAKGFT